MGAVDPRTQTFVIPAFGSLSSAIDLKSLHMCGLTYPALSESIEKLVLWACDTEDGTYVIVKDRENVPWSIDVDQDVAARVQFEPGLLGGFRWVKFQTTDAEYSPLTIDDENMELVPAIRDFR